jgi:hypothetical protein
MKILLPFKVRIIKNEKINPSCLFYLFNPIPENPHYCVWTNALLVLGDCGWDEGCSAEGI